jgi:hypothetical protein
VLKVKLLIATWLKNTALNPNASTHINKQFLVYFKGYLQINSSIMGEINEPKSTNLNVDWSIGGMVRGIGVPNLLTIASVTNFIPNAQR